MRSRTGVTLLELIIVIIILMILMSLFLPVLGNARRRATQWACESQMSRIGSAVAAYGRDYERPPPRSWLPSVDRNSVFLPSALERYLAGETKMFTCPNDTAGFTDRPPPNGGRSFVETERSSYSYMPATGVAEYESFHDTAPRP